MKYIVAESLDLNNAYDTYKLKKYRNNNKIFYYSAFMINLKNEV